MHGISRGAITQAQGGRFSSGFWSGFVSSGFSVGTNGFGNIGGRTAIMGVVGGTTSVISGGKFANGAVTGAFVHMYNAESIADNAWSTVKRVWNRAVENYNETMNVFTIGPINIGSSVSTFAAIKTHNNSANGLFYKEPYLGKLKWLGSSFKTTSMGFVDTALFRVAEPIAIGTVAFSGGVAIGSAFVAISEEF